MTLSDLEGRDARGPFFRSYRETNSYQIRHGNSYGNGRVCKVPSTPNFGGSPLLMLYTDNDKIWRGNTYGRGLCSRGQPRPPMARGGAAALPIFGSPLLMPVNGLS